MNNAHLISYFSTKRYFAIGVVFCVSILSVIGQMVTGGYYVFDGKSVSLFTPGDPNQAQVREWQIWLYPRGVTPGVPHMGKDGYWGACEGRTVADVEKQLKDGQKEEITFDRFAGKPVGSDLLTHFNPFGPIAIIESLPQQSTNENETAASDFRQLKEWGDKLKELNEFASKIKVAVSGDEPSTYEVGGRVQEYMENLQTAEQNLEQLKMLLNNSTDNGLSKIQDLISQITVSLQDDELLQPQITSELNLYDVKNTGDLNSQSSSTNAHAERVTEQSTEALESLINSLGRSTDQLLRLKKARQQLADALDRTKRNKAANISRLQTILTRGQAFRQGSWKVQARDQNGSYHDGTVTLDETLFNAGVDLPGWGWSWGRTLPVTDVEDLGPDPQHNNERAIAVDDADAGLSSIVLFASSKSALQFKAALEQNITLAKHPVTQADIYSAEQSCDSQIANIKAQLSELDAKQTLLQQTQNETETQIESGGGMGKIAATFEVDLIRRKAYAEAPAAQNEGQRAEPLLAEPRQTLVEANDSRKMAKLKEDKAMPDAMNVQQTPVGSEQSAKAARFANAERQRELLDAVKDQSENRVLLLLHQGVNPNVYDALGMTPLTLAVSKGEMSIVEDLLQVGSLDPNLPVRKYSPSGFAGLTPIYIGAKLNNLKMLDLLIGKLTEDQRVSKEVKAGWFVDAGSGDNLGQSQDPSTLRGDKIIQLMLKQGFSDVNATDEDGQTALFNAVFFGNAPAVRTLIRAGIDVNKRDNSGQNALSFGLTSSEAAWNVDTVKLLLGAGSDFGQQSSDGENALDVAYHTYQWIDPQVKVVAKMLCDRGLRAKTVSLRDFFGWLAEKN
jgi:ankyrin repeat protein